jgi:hypothetical protein
LARSFTKAGDHELLSSAAQGTTLTVMARIGLRDLVYLLAAAFTTAAALDFGQQPHGMVHDDSVDQSIAEQGGTE